MTKSLLLKAMLSTALGLFVGFAVFAQQRSISGTVKGEDGQPIPGVTVMIKGTSTGASTGADGKYTFNFTHPNPVLAVSCIGYVGQEVEIGNQRVIDFVLVEETTSLEETVVVGYAVGNKRTITGAVDRVTEENMNTGYVATAVDAIRGKVPGLVISSNGGNVQDNPTIRLRGTTSLSGGNTPLVIMDGVFGDVGMLFSLSPDDIQEITVLKDASETAQYGSRGAAGVIVVTTKKGREGRSQIEYRGQFGVSNPYKKLQVLNASEYRALNSSKFGGAGIDMGDDTYWMDWIMNDFVTQNNHNLSFTSGNSKSNLNASLGIRQRDNVVKNAGNTNYMVRMSASQKGLNDKLILEMNVMASLMDKDWIDTGIFTGAAAYNPTFPGHRNTTTGLWDYDPNAETITHPGDYLDYIHKENVYRVVTSGRITYKIIDGLTASVFGSFNYANRLNRNYFPHDVKSYRVARGEANNSTNLNTNKMASFQLSYSKTLGKHAISALALTEAQRYNYWYNYAKSTGFETDYFTFNNMQAGSTVKWGDVQTSATEYTLMSYLGRLNYMFDNRYVITLNARADGSSKLGANHKWGFFPSASVAWIVSNEGFMKNQKLFNNLKVRVGYGVTGNQDAIDPYRSLSLMAPNGTTTYNGATVTTYALDSNPNPDLKWETKYTFDAGIDFSMWRGRFSGTIDAYMSTTKDLLYTYQVPVPPFTYTSLLANMGEMSNNGIEFGFHVAPIEKKDMGLTIQGNVAFQKNKLVSLSGTYQGQELTTSKYIALSSASCNGLTSNTNVVYMTEGYPVNIFRLPVHDGFKTDDTGKKTYQVKDVNGDGGITLDDEGDREFLGQATPKVFASLGGTFRFKNWDLSTQMNGGFGHHIYNFTSLRLSNLGAFPTYNVLKSAEELGVYNAQHTSYWLEKGDYVNIEYITLGYNLPASKLGLKNIKGLRFALSCNNVFTFTGYSGLTPILNNMSIGGGIDNNVFPIMRTYTAMLSVKF